MPPKRADAFQTVLDVLRARLTAGAIPWGAQVAATDIAESLRLSPTPVREALSRLAGEGLLEDRRGLGYFVRALPAAEIADLYRLSLAHLLIAAGGAEDPPGVAAPAAASTPLEPLDAVLLSEHILEAWVAGSCSRALLDSYRRLRVQLGPARRAEPQALPDLERETQELAALDPRRDRAAAQRFLRSFHGRRIRMAGRLAALAERRAREAGQ
jgi:DNA-binding GntR family transcriptional regulator